MKKQFKNLVQVALVAFILLQPLASYAQTISATPHPDLARQMNESPSKAQNKNMQASASLSPSDGEPLLLLLFGLAVFVAATTIKKRSHSR